MRGDLDQQGCGVGDLIAVRIQLVQALDDFDFPATLLDGTIQELAGLIELVRSGRLDDRDVVFWHAGGTPGLFEPLDR